MGKTFLELGTPVRNISIDLTEGCSLRCKYCFQDFLSEKRENRKLTESMMKDIIDWYFDDKITGTQDEVNKTGGLGIELWGGEPMHNWEILVKLVEYQNEKSKITGKKIKYGGTTNQVEFSKERLEFLYQNNVHLLISYDGYYNYKYRIFPDGSGSSEIILKNIDLYYDVYKVPPQVRMSIHPDYVDTLYKSYEIILSKGIRSYFFSPVFEQEWKDEHLEIMKEQLIKIYKKEQRMIKFGFPPLKNKFIDEMIHLIVNSRKIGVDLDTEVDTGNFTRENILKIQPNKSTRPCGQGTHYFGISVDGHIYVCHRFNKHNLDETKFPFEKRYGHMGDIYNNITNIELYNELLNWDVNDLEHCKKCKFKYICNGGCYQSNYDVSGNIKGKVEYQCKIKFALYEAQKEILNIYEELGIYDKQNNILKINDFQFKSKPYNFDKEFKSCNCYSAAYLVKDVEDVLQNLKVDKEMKDDMKLKLAKQGIETAMAILEELDHPKKNKLEFKI